MTDFENTLEKPRGGKKRRERQREREKGSKTRSNGSHKEYK